MVQETDAATRCGLQGPYWLQVGDDTLLLRDTQTKNIVKEWPYELLRRYGKDKVNVSDFPIKYNTVFTKLNREHFTPVLALLLILHFLFPPDGPDH